MRDVHDYAAAVIIAQGKDKVEERWLINTLVVGFKWTKKEKCGEELHWASSLQSCPMWRHCQSSKQEEG
jgi:hypothetical protein